MDEGITLLLNCVNLDKTLFMKLPGIETLIFFTFIGCVVVWGISTCTDRRSEAMRTVREMEDTEPAPAATTAQEKSAPGKVSEETVSKPKEPQTEQPKQTPVTAKTSTATDDAAGVPLFVTIDGLKLRKEPGLKGEAVEQLKLNEQVTFLNQKTDWSQEINMGDEKVTDYWVKVRTASGKTGWVFGAGLHYYKMKRPAKPAAVKTPAGTTSKKSGTSEWNEQ